VTTFPVHERWRLRVATLRALAEQLGLGRDGGRRNGGRRDGGRRDGGRRESIPGTRALFDLEARFGALISVDLPLVAFAPLAEFAPAFPGQSVGSPRPGKAGVPAARASTDSLASGVGASSRREPTSTSTSARRLGGSAVTPLPAATRGAASAGSLLAAPQATPGATEAAHGSDAAGGGLAPVFRLRPLAERAGHAASSWLADPRRAAPREQVRGLGKQAPGAPGVARHAAGHNGVENGRSPRVGLALLADRVAATDLARGRSPWPRAHHATVRPGTSPASDQRAAPVGSSAGPSTGPSTGLSTRLNAGRAPRAPWNATAGGERIDRALEGERSAPLAFETPRVFQTPDAGIPDPTDHQALGPATVAAHTVPAHTMPAHSVPFDGDISGDTLAELVGEALAAQARLHGVDLS